MSGESEIFKSEISSAASLVFSTFKTDIPSIEITSPPEK